jgi:hypothetical protein
MSSTRQRRNVNEIPRTEGIIANLFADVPVPLIESNLASSSES